MGLIGYVAIVASFLMLPLGYDQRARAPFSVLLAIPIMQTVGLYTSLSFIAARPTDTDTITYFYDLFGALGDGIKPGTSFIVYLTSFVTNLTGASFEDLMALYSLSGVAASFLLLRYLTATGYRGPYPQMAAFAVLLPTFHFYTTAIGKDGLSALAMVLIMIGSSDLPSRWRSFSAGFLLLVLVRPHIAAAAGLAFLLAQMISSRNRWSRIAVLPGLAIGAIVAFFVFRSFLGINIFNLSEVSMFLGERSDALSTSSYTINASDNLAIRLLGFMYFPLFFNADSLIAVAASIENTILIAITVRVVISISYRLVRKNQNVVFLLILIGMLWVFMGVTSYNIGLGLRTKTSMVTPVILALFALTEVLRWKATGERPVSGVLAVTGPVSSSTA